MGKSQPAARRKTAKFRQIWQEGSRNRPPIERPYFTLEQVAVALVECRGRCSKIGRMLGCCAHPKKTVRTREHRQRGSRMRMICVTVLSGQSLVEPDEVKRCPPGQGAATILNCAAQANVVRAVSLCRIVR